MKYFIASDIHGSAYYCKKMLEKYQASGADRLILLGDILYHGPRNDLPFGYEPKKVIDLLNAVSPLPLCVQGNCEAPVDQMVLKFPITAEYALLAYGNKTVFITHGDKYNKNNMPLLQKGDVLLHGHTHIPAAEWLESGVAYLNPGSTSLPKVGSSNGYMIFEDGVFTRYNLDGMAESTFNMTALTEETEPKNTAE